MATDLGNAIQSTSVKFYATKNRQEAKALVSSEPGAICFVSDNNGNSIYLNGQMFGGTVASVNGKVGVVTINLSDLLVCETTINNVTTSKYLSDYFDDNNGTFYADVIKIRKEINGSLTDSIVIQSDSITINGKRVLTEDDLSGIPGMSAIQDAIDDAEQSAKDYADSLVTSIYRVKGSVTNYSDLASIQNPSEGDVYNVVNAYGIMGQAGYIPAGTNFVYRQDSGNTYVWDPLGGTFDFSSYVTRSTVEDIANTAETNANNYTDTQIGTVNSTLNSHTSTLSTHTTNINNLTNQLTWQ